MPTFEVCMVLKYELNVEKNMDRYSACLAFKYTGDSLIVRMRDQYLLELQGLVSS